MLKANYQNKLIDLTQVSNTELEALLLNRGGHTCPYCQEPVILKSGTKKRAHFAHRSLCSQTASDPESQEHKLAKQLLKEWLKMQGANEIKCEKRFEDIHRIADLYFEFEGQHYVVEIQKSHLSEVEFKSRTMDYESQDIHVIWVFIGDLTHKSQTYLLNRQMRLNRESVLIHLNLSTKRITLIRSRVWLSQKEVKAESETYVLPHMPLSNLIENRWSTSFITRQDWLTIKRQFRQSKWFYYFKTDRRLTRLCLIHQFNLSLMPAEIGWPIINNYGFTRPLLIWQAYVLIGIIMSHPIGDMITVGQMAEVLKKRYKIAVNDQAIYELKQYLQFLVKQRVLTLNYGYYEIIRHPKGYQTLESALEADEKMSATFQFEF